LGKLKENGGGIFIGGEKASQEERGGRPFFLSMVKEVSFLCGGKQQLMIRGQEQLSSTDVH